MKLLLYCTKAKPYLNDYRKVEFCNKFVVMSKKVDDVNCNGKIVAECDFEVEKIQAIYINEYVYDLHHSFYRIQDDKEWLDKTCLNMAQLDNYLKGKNGYAIHIKNLKIFDEPKELSEYDDVMAKPLNKAPQNMMYAYRLKSESMYDECNFIGYDYYVEEYTLISIQPQWLCKILNGEKTIEVRKKVLKEMR